MRAEKVCSSHKDFKSQKELCVSQLQSPVWNRDGYYEPKYREEIGYRITNRPIKLKSPVGITLHFFC